MFRINVKNVIEELALCRAKGNTGAEEADSGVPVIVVGKKMDDVTMVNSNIWLTLLHDMVQVCTQLNHLIRLVH